jgi:alcohol dehydrogenase (cytochrome c)
MFLLLAEEARKGNPGPCGTTSTKEVKMKTLVFGFIPLFAACSMMFGQAGMNGVWRLGEIGQPFLWEVVLRDDAGQLSGTVSSCASGQGPVEISGAKIEVTHITFECKSADGQRTIAFAGAIHDDEIDLTWVGSDRPPVTDGLLAGDKVFGLAAPSRFILKRVRPVSFDRILHADREPQNWLTYSGSLLGIRHSLLSQITPANVRNLELAWIWQAQSLRTFEATALVVDGVLYTVQPPNDVVALDAATGRVLWTFPYTPIPQARTSGGGGKVNRGLAILGDALFLGTLDAHLLAVNAHTGKLIWNTTVADARDPACQGRLCYSITHAPLALKDKVIVGVAGGEGPIRGFIAAFDAVTGREVWRFHTVPGRGEPGNETWSGESWRTGGGGVWNTGAYDADLNLTYWGTGNPFPVTNGSSRAGDNLYTESVVALDADSGKLRWHYQFTPHDTMDWDATQVPVLTDIEWQGRSRKAMLWGNRNGLMYVLDRATGEFLSGKPFVEVNWMNGFDEKGRPKRVAPNVAGSMVLPGSGTNWQPPSYSPTTGLFYIPSWDGANSGIVESASPNYGAVRAFDPHTGEKKWEFRGNDAHFTSGVLTTASGLLFSGTADGYLYALDARTGELLWRVSLPGSVTSGPMSYSIAGKQYVTVAAGNVLFAFAVRQ